jgi:hypothetical protein
MSPGPPPRYPEFQHRRRPPGRGEWVDLTPIEGKPVLGPRRGAVVRAGEGDLGGVAPRPRHPRLGFGR